MINKAQEDANHWFRLDRQTFRISEFFLYHQDRVQVTPDFEIDYFYVERPKSATVVARTRNNEVAMLRQYRYPVNTWCWELPAGAFIQEEDKNLQETAQRELKEEAGIICQSLEEIGHFYVASHLSNETTHVFTGTIDTIEENKLEASETLSIYFVPAAKALDMARKGEIHDGPSALALLLAEKWLV